jgi:hypothetical protein
VVLEGGATAGAVRARCVRCDLLWSFQVERRAPVADPVTAEEVEQVRRLLDESIEPVVEVLRRAG